MAFFDNETQMAMTHSTRIQFQSEGMTSLDDLVDCDEDNISTISDNLRRPRGRIPDLNYSANAVDTMHALPFGFGAKSQMKLAAAYDLAR